ncbi:hypothetical protein [Streptantibioticus ferralitis]|uniref:Uncharacterized protein n=1 Tax=Streptantibioticus ferralitis TaxID=236510 RepID=A0ABT5YU58_9ACTN|nr:hypothetical protein [Streptantibioticus ferralitis]MDF2255139.1 hypothetical protein [Streptantibioticus ferralitis]
MLYTFPDDLMQAQLDWYAVYHQLAGAEHESQTTVLRRTLQRLSVRISTHPYWASLPGSVPAARMELKQAAWQAVHEKTGPRARA